MDYREWTERAKGFIETFKRSHPHRKARVDIGPPASLDRIVRVETSIDRPLPRQLREFLASASGDCDFGYWWEPDGESQSQEVVAAFGSKTIPGGLEFFARLDCMADDYEFQKELVEEGVFGDAPFLRDPLPIGGMGNGDHIAIDLRGESVIFLAHDDESFVLAPDFDTFLASWEAICYLDFDISPYERFIDKNGGGIDPTDRPELRRLRGLLLPEERGEEAFRAPPSQ